MSTDPLIAVELTDAAGSETGVDRPLRLSMPARAAVGGLSVCLGALAFASYAVGVGAAIAAFVAVVLVVLAAIDVRRRIIPNHIVLPATMVVLLARVAEFPGRGLHFLLASIATGAILLLPNLVNSSAMGMGDVKLGLLLGAALGWAGMGALLVAFLCARPAAAANLIRGGRAATTHRRSRSARSSRLAAL